MRNPATSRQGTGSASMETLPDELIAVVRRGEMKKMAKWLRKGSVDAQDAEGNTLLHVAVYHGHADVMRDLIKRGATIDVANEDGGTALMVACQLGSLPEVSLLLHHSADVDWQNPHGATALHTAAAHDNPGALMLLLDKSAMVDIQTTDGYTALMSAAGAGSDSCVRLLLDGGVTVALQNNMGQTALRCAEIKGHVSTQLLLQRACTPPGSPCELAHDAVLLKMKDGRCVHVPESSMRRPVASPACPESQRTPRRLHRATGLLARDMRD